MTGIMTFSSSWPASAASATVWSLPITCQQTWFTISAMLGFTLPGMMLEPGCTAGSTTSAKPVRGPEARSLRSLAILFRSTANARSAPENAATSPMDCMSCTRSSPTRSSRPAFRFRYFTMSSGYWGSALSPVPTAVPPMPSSRRSSAARSRRLRLRATVCPYAVNSWPRRIGVASWRWVRPDFMMWSKAFPLARNAAARPSAAARSGARRESAASRIAVGITSLVLCAMLT